MSTSRRIQFERSQVHLQLVSASGRSSEAHLGQAGQRERLDMITHHFLFQKIAACTHFSLPSLHLHANLIGKIRGSNFLLHCSRSILTSFRNWRCIDKAN